MWFYCGCFLSVTELIYQSYIVNYQVMQHMKIITQFDEENTDDTIILISVKSELYTLFCEYRVLILCSFVNLKCLLIHGCLLLLRLWKINTKYNPFKEYKVGLNVYECVLSKLSWQACVMFYVRCKISPLYQCVFNKGSIKRVGVKTAKVLSHICVYKIRYKVQKGLMAIIEFF